MTLTPDTTTEALDARHVSPPAAHDTPAPEPGPLSPEAIDEHNAGIRQRLQIFTKSVNQGEWLQITRLLDLTRAEIGEDGALSLLALAWVKEKRSRGAASIDVLLEKTDDELSIYHGFIVE